jgi:hypothetical protein
MLAGLPGREKPPPPDASCGSTTATAFRKSRAVEIAGTCRPNRPARLWREVSMSRLARSPRRPASVWRALSMTSAAHGPPGSALASAKCSSRCRRSASLSSDVKRDRGLCTRIVSCVSPALGIRASAGIRRADQGAARCGTVGARVSSGKDADAAGHAFCEAGRNAARRRVGTRPGRRNVRVRRAQYWHHCRRCRGERGERRCCVLRLRLLRR